MGRGRCTHGSDTSIDGSSPMAPHRAFFLEPAGRPVDIATTSSTATCQEATAMYENVSLFIDGKLTRGDSGAESDVVNPAKDAVLAKLPHAKKPELDKALAAADKGFKAWRKVNSYE